MKTNLHTLFFFITFLSLQAAHAQWQQTNGPEGGYIDCLAGDGTNLYAGSAYGGIFSSNDNGNTWTSHYYSSFYYQFSSILIDATNVYAATSNGVLNSTDYGQTWNPINTGLTYFSNSSLAKMGSLLFTGSLGGGVSLSTNNGANWNAVNTGLTDLDVKCLAVTGTNIFAGTNGGGVF